jgi:hypothetical protein
MLIFLLKLLVCGALSIIALGIIYWVTDLRRRLGK